MSSLPRLESAHRSHVRALEFQRATPGKGEPWLRALTGFSWRRSVARRGGRKDRPETLERAREFLEGVAHSTQFSSARTLPRHIASRTVGGNSPLGGEGYHERRAVRLGRIGLNSPNSIEPRKH